MNDEFKITLKEELIRQLKELYMAKVVRILPQVLATMNSYGSKELCVSRKPVAPPQAWQSTLSSRVTIPDPSDTCMAPQFQESFEQVA